MLGRWRKCLRRVPRSAASQMSSKAGAVASACSIIDLMELLQNLKVCPTALRCLHAF